MSLTPDEAAKSLEEIEETGQRSAFAQGYARSSPYFTIWGVIWVIGYAATDILYKTGERGFVSLLWFSLALVGVAACGVVSRRHYYQGRAGADLAKARAVGKRIGLSTLIIYIFVGATFAVMQPRNPMASGAFIPIVLATYYALFGIWRGMRFLVIGAMLAVLTLGGFFMLGSYFLLWMAVVGGGSLILFGQWLKRL